MNIFVPDNIRKYITDKPFETDEIGMSKSSVLIFDDMVLKIENHTASTDKAVEMLNWLSGKMPVPKVICYETYNGKSYTLMSKISGKMTCDESYMEQADRTVSLLAEGLKLLWSVDISDCPNKLTFEHDLVTARQNVEKGLIDACAIDIELLNKNGFNDVYHLLRWLENNIPECEPVLSHGDYCMPNILLENDRISGFIDLGDCAVADRWKDISTCYISLRNNFSGFWGGKVYPDFNADILFEKLGIAVDKDKLNYYLLLNELFKTL